MPSMTRDEMNSFLQGPNIAKIATVREDGWPYVVPVWYEWDGEHIYVIGRKRSEWVKYLRTEPRVCVLIDETNPPYRKVLIEGRAKVLESEWTEIGRRMCNRYFGEALGPKYFEGSADQPRWLVEVVPERVKTWIIPPEYGGDRRAWHPRYYEPGTKWYIEYHRELTKRR